MKKNILFFLLITSLFVKTNIFSQVAVNDNGAAPNSNAILDVDISSNDKGILIPRLTTAQRNNLALGTSDEGLTVYDETIKAFVFWNGTSWKEQTTQGANWSVIGNSAINSTSNFIGTLDANDFVVKTNNTERARITSGGNIGINTTNPDVYLHIFGDDVNTTNDDATYSNGTGLLVIGNTAERNLVLDQNEILARDNGASSYLYLQNRGGGLRFHYDCPTTSHDDGTQVTILDNGNLGVGFLTPEDKIHIYGTLPYIRFTDSEGGHSWNAGVYGNSGFQRFQITEFTGSSSYRQRLVIKEGGNVGIGTVTPEGLLHVKADNTNNATFLLDADAGDDANDTWKLRSDATSHNLDFYNDVNNRVSFTSIGNVGIGTSSPQKILHIKNSVPYIRYDDTDGGNYWETGLTGGDFRFYEDVNVRFVVKAGGNVGIGTTNPDAKLHVLLSGTVMGQYAGTVATFQQNGATTDWARMSIIGGNAGASVIDFGDADKQDIGMLKYDHTDNYLSYSYNGGEILRIEDYGYVGIGKTNPSEKLDINGAILIGNTNNSNAGAIRWNGSNFQGFDGSNWKPLDVQTTTGGGWTDGGTNVYLTTTSDNVGVGTNSPSAKLDVNGDIYASQDITTNADLWSDNAYITTDLETGGIVKVGTKINRTAQGTTDLIPVAYGIVSYDGTIGNSGTGNWSVTRTSTGRYDITITNESYSSSSYMTQITPRYLSTGTTSNDVRVASFGDSSNKLRVYIKDGDGDFSNTTFHFIIYKQ